MVHVWMNVFLGLHHDVVMTSKPVHLAVREWREQEEETSRSLDELISYSSGVVDFLRSPRV
jgi:hypothetical protein